MFARIVQPCIAALVTVVLVSPPSSVLGQDRVGPSFDCASVAAQTERLPQVICGSGELSRVELSYVAAYQALRHSLAEPERGALFREAQAGTERMTRECILSPSSSSGPRPSSPREIACLKSLYVELTGALHGRLPREALDEARMQPEQLMRLQTQLKSRRLLPAGAVVDGVIGPQTRTAIVAMQQELGLKANGFASPAMLDSLQRVPSPLATPAVPAQPPPVVPPQTGANGAPAQSTGSTPPLRALSICNETPAKVWAAVGIASPAGKRAIGWYEVAPGACLSPLQGQKVPDGSRFFFAANSEALVSGGSFEWKGDSEHFCIHSRNEFDVDRHTNCGEGLALRGMRPIANDRARLECDDACWRKFGIAPAAAYKTQSGFVKANPTRPAPELGYPDFPNARVDAATARCLERIREDIAFIDRLPTPTPNGEKGRRATRDSLTNGTWIAPLTRAQILSRLQAAREQLPQRIKEAEQDVRTVEAMLGTRRVHDIAQIARVNICRADPKCRVTHDPTSENYQSLSALERDLVSITSLAAITKNLAESEIRYNECLLDARGLLE